MIMQGDALKLFKLESASVSVEPSNFRNELDENNEELFYLQLNEPNKVDLDKVFRQKNQNPLYILTVTAQLADRPDVSTSVEIRFNLVDINDNSPTLVSKQPGDELITIVDDLQAFISRPHKANTPIAFKQDVRFTDLDFSPEFGIESIYFSVNDTRFQVNNQMIFNHLQSKQTSDFTIPFVLNKLTSSNDDEATVSDDENKVIWIEVTVQDNYFSRRSNRARHNSKKFIVKLTVLDDKAVVFISDNNNDQRDQISGDFKNLPKNTFNQNLTRFHEETKAQLLVI